MLLGEPPARRALGSSRGALRLPGFALASAAILFTWIGFGALEGVLPLHFDDRLGQAAIAGLFIMVSVAVTTSAAAAGRIRPRRVLCVAVPLVVVGIALAGLTDAVLLWVLALLLAGVGMGACNTGSTGVLLESVGVDAVHTPRPSHVTSERVARKGGMNAFDAPCRGTARACGRPTSSRTTSSNAVTGCYRRVMGPDQTRVVSDPSA